MTRVFECDDLSIRYHLPDQTIRAVEHTHIFLDKNRVHALIGESGSGKSSIGKALLGLLPAYSSITFKKLIMFDRTFITPEEIPWNKIRGRQITIVFQNPELSLNPVIKIKDHFMHCIHSLPESTHRSMNFVHHLLDILGFHDTNRILNAYPSELSGGMLQRIALALALLPEPTILVADEPTTALDVTLQAQFLSYIRSIQKTKHLTILWITHDLRVVAEIADWVHVMYQGWLVEHAPVHAFFDEPLHPYSQFLRSALTDATFRRSPLVNHHPSPPSPLSTCPYIHLCPFKKKMCEQRIPLIQVTNRRMVRCILYR